MLPFIWYCSSPRATPSSLVDLHHSMDQLKYFVAFEDCILPFSMSVISVKIMQSGPGSEWDFLADFSSYHNWWLKSTATQSRAKKHHFYQLKMSKQITLLVSNQAIYWQLYPKIFPMTWVFLNSKSFSPDLAELIVFFCHEIFTRSHGMKNQQHAALPYCLKIQPAQRCQGCRIGRVS